MGVWVCGCVGVSVWLCGLCGIMTCRFVFLFIVFVFVCFIKSKCVFCLMLMCVVDFACASVVIFN